MGIKGGQQYNVGQCPYKKPTISTCEALHSKGTCVKLNGDVLHIKGFKIMSLHKMCPHPSFTIAHKLHHSSQAMYFNGSTPPT